MPLFKEEGYESQYRQASKQSPLLNTLFEQFRP
jgi:hypothetical protein